MMPSPLSTLSRLESLRLASSRPATSRAASSRAASPSLTLPLLAMVPPIAVGLGSDGLAAALSLVIGVSLPTLVAAGFLSSMAGRLLAPISFGVFFFASILLLPFNSLGFFVDAGTTLLLGLATIPRGRPAWADSV